MPSITKPITTFKKTLVRASDLINLFGTGPSLVEKDDLLRASTIFSVAAFDRYFTSKFCDVLVPHLKSEEKISEGVLDMLRDAGLDTNFALELAISSRPFRKIRTIVQNSLSKHTTHRTSVIDKLFLSLSLKDLSSNAERMAGRKNLVTRLSKLVDIRNDIAHEAHNDSRGNPKAIRAGDIESRISDMEIFVTNCDTIINKRFGITEPVSA